MTDMAVEPLQRKNPRGGRIENFDEMEEAKSLAEVEKMK